MERREICSNTVCMGAEGVLKLYHSGRCTHLVAVCSVRLEHRVKGLLWPPIILAMRVDLDPRELTQQTCKQKHDFLEGLLINPQSESSRISHK